MHKNLIEEYQKKANEEPLLKEFVSNNWLLEVLEMIENGREKCRKLGLQFDSPMAKKLLIDDLILKERDQKGHHFNHINLTVHAPYHKGSDYEYQICFPPPHCVRLLLSFQDNNPKIDINTKGIEKKPVIDSIFAVHGDARIGTEAMTETKDTLNKSIQLFDSIGLQRIGVVGFARNMPDYNEEDKNRQKGYEELKMISTSQHRSMYASIHLDAFINKLRGLKIPLTTVSGGWAGQKGSVRTVGVPFLAHLFGHEDILLETKSTSVGSESKKSLGNHLSFFPPLTVMPSKGVSDSVDTEPGTHEFKAHMQKKSALIGETIGFRSQFIFPGEWGDESPYLAALCTAMVVIEPAGRWTQIEMLNAMEQDIPVVILASPENYDENWMINFTGTKHKINQHYRGLNEGLKYVDIDLPTKSNPVAKVRAFRNPEDAALYLAKLFTLKEINNETFNQIIETKHGQKELATLIESLADGSVLNDKNLATSPSWLKSLKGKNKEWLCHLQKVSSIEDGSKNNYDYGALFKKMNYNGKCLLTLGTKDDVPTDITDLAF